MTFLDDFKSNGFVILPKVIDKHLIDDVLVSIEEMKTRRPIFYSQSKHRVLRTHFR